MLRNTATSLNGEPALSTPDADEALQATLQHVVLTYNATEGRKIYVNGKLIEVSDEEIAPLASWDDSFALILGQEASNNHVWQGNIRLLALYNKAMTGEQIQQNFDVGVGERYYLLFSIGDLIDLPNTYVMFEISEFDNYSYLFNQPAIVNLDQKKLGTALIIEGLNIGINGKESGQSQVYANLSRTLNTEDTLNETQRLSELGTIIAIEKGAEQDEFFLSFERLGEHSNIKVEGELVLTPESPATTESPSIGLRNFDEIHASMSQLTGVAQDNNKVYGVYQLIQRQLPSINNIETFISAQQMAITQLAIAYCDRAIEDTTLRSAWFPNINFNVEPNIALAVAQREQFITPLLAQLMPLNLTSQPMKADASNELNNLIDRLSVCNNNCDAVRTRTIAKASCAAILASAVTLVQ
jgi:hypothetical protein